ncbi:uncharacterized protein LOC120148544 [Hibiscus syriacus]|uniref:uncharacterized protein LOC120148544 n=1 Tax=Hibiscus syriacus TaxID=106335 RepID=UPI001922BA13|nr:uncharacterized protein LOC120148544 [Hibiscus syriacus]
MPRKPKVIFPPPPKSIDSNPIVCPPPEVFEAGTSVWKSSLVGQFLGAPPNFNALQRIIETLWNHPAKGEGVQVSYAGNNVYIFSFANDSVRDWVLENGPWHVFNKPLILRIWEANMQKLDFDFAHLPIWIHLYNVPLELYTQDGLSSIASALGKPISMDSFTASKTRLHFAKVCVEGNQSPWTLSLLLKLDCTLLNCKKCAKFGHSDKNCPSQHSTAPMKIWRKKAEVNISIETKPLENSDELQQNLPEPSDSHSEVVTSSIDENSHNTEIQPNKSRLAALGVANLLKELKTTKKEHLVKTKTPVDKGETSKSSSL